MKVLKNDLIAQFVFFLTNLIFALSINFVHSTYLYESQEFWGYTYYELTFDKWLIVFFSIFLTSLVTPLKIAKPSSIILYTLHIAVIIPTIIITLGLRKDSIEIYGLEIFCLIFGYCISAVASALTGNIKNNNYDYYVPNINSERMFLALWFICFFTLLFSFRDIINFVGLDDIYTQRAAGKSRNLFEAYMQTYLPNVICAALMAFGLIKNKYTYIMLSVAGYLLMFGINAQRTVFLMPIILYGLYKYLNSNSFKKGILISFNMFLSSVFYIVAILPNGAIRDFFGFYIVTRVFATPGIMLSLYHDVFSVTSYTYWSHIKGISLIVSKPDFFANNLDWPQLGYIVADYRLGIISNSNANIFAADGVAAAGGIGVIVISMIFAFYLFFLDSLSKDIDPNFKVIVAFPIGFALTNGSLATILLSFGGIFWLLFYFYIKTKKLR
jgi:hypothetical protein